VAVTTTGSRITAELLSDGCSSAQAWIEVTPTNASGTEIE